MFTLTHTVDDTIFDKVLLRIPKVFDQNNQLFTKFTFTGNANEQIKCTFYDVSGTALDLSQWQKIVCTTKRYNNTVAYDEQFITTNTNEVTFNLYPGLLSYNISSTSAFTITLDGLLGNNLHKNEQIYIYDTITSANSGYTTITNVTENQSTVKTNVSLTKSLSSGEVSAKFVHYEIFGNPTSYDYRTYVYGYKDNEQPTILLRAFPTEITPLANPALNVSVPQYLPISITDAPVDNKHYARKNNVWFSIENYLTQVQTSSADITKLQSDVNYISGIVSINTADISTIQNDITNLQSVDTALSAFFDQIDSRVQTVSSDLDDITTTVQSNSSQWSQTSATTAISAIYADKLDGYDASAFSQVTHNHNLNNLAEKSYNSLTDKPDLNAYSLSSHIHQKYENLYSVVASNSANWALSGSDISSLTGKWESASTVVQSNSANWDGVYTTVKTNSASWIGGGSEVSTLTGKWESASNVVQSNSANWNTIVSVSGDIGYLSGQIDLIDTSKGDDAWTTVSKTSANWNNTSTIVSQYSASWLLSGSDVSTLTSKWESASNVVTSNSANWNGTYTTVNSNSSVWNTQNNHTHQTYDNTFSTVSSNSASWVNDQSVNSIVHSNSADWNKIHAVSGDISYLSGQINNISTIKGDDAWNSVSSTSAQWTSAYVRAFNSNPHNGFDNQTDSTISFNSSNRIFTIQPNLTSYSWYSNGVQFTSSVPITTQIANINGLHYIYFDESGHIQNSSSIWSITSNNVPTSIIEWNGTSGLILCERHSKKRNRAWHEWAHQTIGARYYNGYDASFTNTTLSVSAGSIYDEDIVSSLGTTETNCIIWYRNGTSTMTFDSVPSTTPYKLAGGNNSLRYDNNGSLATAKPNRYVVSWIYATNDCNYKVYCVLGQAEYTTLASAQTATLPSIPISTAEWKLLYKVIYQNNASPTYNSTQDYRIVSSGPPTTYSPPTNPPAGAVGTDTNNFNSILSVSDTTVQTALDTLDDHLHDYRYLLSGTAVNVISAQMNQTLSSFYNYDDNSVNSVVHSTSSNWNGVYTTVQTNSSVWNIQNNHIHSTYDNVFTNVTSNSANWNGVYTTVQSNSASWSGGSFDITTTSATIQATLSSSWTYPRVTAITSSSTPTPNCDTTDLYDITALAAATATFGAPTGTPRNGQMLMIRIKDNGTARTLAYNAIYVSGGPALPTTTVLSKILHLGFMYNTANSLNKWMLIAIAQE